MQIFSTPVARERWSNAVRLALPDRVRSDLGADLEARILRQTQDATMPPDPNASA